MSLEEQAQVALTRLSSASSTDSAVSTPTFSPRPKHVHILRLMDPESPSTPKEIAEYFHEMPHTDPRMVGQVLGEPDARSLSVLHEYAKGFQFQGVAFDVALRVFLGRFELPGEAQKIDRILQAFSKAYYESNPDSQQCPSEDAVYTLAFSLLLLNTDAHNPRLSRKFKMTKVDFIRNYHRLGGDGGSARPEVPDAYLAHCYDLYVADQIKRVEKKTVEILPDEVELEFPHAALGLEIETSFDGRDCVVKSYNNDRHMYSSRRRRASTGSNSRSPGGAIAAIPRAISAIFVTEPPEPSLAGWVIVAVGDDSTRQIGYNLTRYLLKTAPRPVCIRFCEPSAYFEALE